VSNNTPGTVDDALRLAAYGRPVFPCGLHKKPHTEHGFQDASTDADIIRTWWRQWPDALVAVPTGEASGLFAIDVDSARHEEANDWLERHSPYLPETRQHATKSGGWHLLFKHQLGLRNSTSKLAKGVDTRGEGGYIIWWPFHLGLNAPHKLDNPLAELPDWLAEKLAPPPNVIEFTRPRFGKTAGAPNKKVQGVLNAVAGTHAGNRNSILCWGACVIRDMIANREINSIEGASAFKALNFVSLNTGLPAREIARTIQSAMQ
jgi:Bifunctional DNA primase/polymerase, N-terminal